MKRTQKSTRGFSLIEISIVLGVIGVLVGGLWVLVGQVSENVRQHALTQDIILTVNNVRATYLSKTAIGGSTTDSSTCLLMQKLINLQTVFPSDMTGGGSNPPSLPWNPGQYGVCGTSSFNVCAWTMGSNSQCPLSAAAQAASPLFAIELRKLPQQSTCINAVVNNSNPSMPAGLVDVYVNGNSVGLGASPPALPVTAANAMAGCSTAATYTVDFIYRLNPSTAP